MDWNVWIADGARDLVLLAAGGGIAWLSGISASKRTERSEREKREIELHSKREEQLRAESLTRREATQRESSRALSVIYEMDRALKALQASRADVEPELPTELMTRLREIGAVTPDETVRNAIDQFIGLFDSYRLLVEWAPVGSDLESNAQTYAERMVYRLRMVLAAAARGDRPEISEAVELESFAVMQRAALDAYWEQQAEDYEEMKLSDMGHSGSRRSD